MNKNTQTDNELCGGCGAHFETESHALNCPNAVTDADTAPRDELKFYREIESGDYLAVDPTTNQYYLDNLGEDSFEGRATAIANDPSSVCTTSVSRRFLDNDCELKTRAQVPAKWLIQFEA